jgi:hypothetical protein
VLLSTHWHGALKLSNACAHTSFFSSVHVCTDSRVLLPHAQPSESDMIMLHHMYDNESWLYAAEDSSVQRPQELARAPDATGPNVVITSDG